MKKSILALALVAMGLWVITPVIVHADTDAAPELSRGGPGGPGGPGHGGPGGGPGGPGPGHPPPPPLPQPPPGAGGPGHGGPGGPGHGYPPPPPHVPQLPEPPPPYHQWPYPNPYPNPYPQPYPYPYPQPNPYGSQFVECDSDNYQLQQCFMDLNRATVNVYNQLSNAPCVFGQTWGYGYNEIWVNNGCRATFIVNRY